MGGFREHDVPGWQVGASAGEASAAHQMSERFQPAASGNGAIGSLFHIGRPGRAVPEPGRSATNE
jgi:hypothetical protein